MLTHAWRTIVWRIFLRSRKVVISDRNFFTSVNTFYNVLWRSARLLFSLTNPCVTNFMILCGKPYVLFYTTTRVASLLTVIRENILMRGLSAKNMILVLIFFMERTLEKKVYTFSKWIFIIVCVRRIDIWYSFCRLHTQKR